MTMQDIPVTPPDPTEQARLALLLDWGNALAGSGNAEEAETHLQQVIEVFPYQAAAHGALAQALYRTGDYERALEAIDRALALEPEHTGWLKTKAAVARALERIDDAILALSEVIILDQRDHVALNALGGLLHMVNRVDEATVMHMTAAQVAGEMGLPVQIDYLMALAVDMRLLKNPAAALEIYNAVLEVAPQTVNAYVHIATLLMQSNNQKEALSTLQRALDLGFDNFDVHVLRAHALHRLKDREGTQAAVHAALRLRPGDSYCQHLLAMSEGRTTDTAPVDYVTRVFDGYAATFEDELLGGLLYETPGRMELMLERVRPQARYAAALDIGCGTGLMGLVLRERVDFLAGIDLSTKMIEKAREKRIYDELTVADIVEAMARDPRRYELITAADVFVYIGNIRPVLEQVRAHLQPGGLFVFSCERMDDGDSFTLRPTGRYAHSLAYVTDLGERLGFSVVATEIIDLRLDGGRPIGGFLVTLGAPS